jgi:hypothetical protein
MYISGENRHGVSGTIAALSVQDLFELDPTKVNPKSTRAVAQSLGNNVFTKSKAAAASLGVQLEDSAITKAQSPAKQEAAARLFIPAEKMQPGAAAKLADLLRRARAGGVSDEAMVSEVRAIYPARVQDDVLYSKVLPQLRTLMQK